MKTATKNKRGPVPGERYPLASLEQFLLGADADTKIQSGNGDYPADRVMPTALARHCNVNVGVVHRWRKEGLTAWAADKAALAIGLHPVIIWPEWAQGGVPRCHE